MAIPATDVDNEIGDIARAAEVFRSTLIDADAAREAAVQNLAAVWVARDSQGAAEWVQQISPRSGSPTSGAPQ